jgi:hypothetical protein
MGSSIGFGSGAVAAWAIPDEPTSESAIHAAKHLVNMLSVMAAVERADPDFTVG